METMIETPAGHRQKNRGMALASVMVLMTLALILTGVLSTMMFTSARGTADARAVENARSAAEAGLNAALFQVEAGTAPSSGPISLETYLTNMMGSAGTGVARPNTRTFTGTLAKTSYVVTMSDPSAGDNMFTLTAVGTDSAVNRTRTLVALVRGDPPAALNYAMFGNTIQFHNHNQVAYGLTLDTAMFSNGSIQIDRGISIQGLAQAVNTIQPNTGPAGGASSLPNTILTPTGQQGDPNPMTSDPNGLVQQVVPAPNVQPFPTFDFYTASTTAAAAGRSVTPSQLTTLIGNAATCAAAMASDGTGRSPGYTGAPSACSVASVYTSSTGVTAANVPLTIIHYKTGAGSTCPSNCPNPRSIAIPNGTNANASVPLGSPDGTSNPAANTNLYEIQLTGVNAPLSNTLLYVNSSLTLQEPTTTLVQIQGSLIANGSVTLHSPVELLAWDNRVGSKFVATGQSLYTDALATTTAQAAPGQPYDVIFSNWPAVAANGGLHVDDSGSGNGGPVHIEGVAYSVAESHFHKSNAYESSYAVGSEVADTIHNCQWFSFAYDPQAKQTLGFFSKATGRAKLSIIQLVSKSS